MASSCLGTVPKASLHSVYEVKRFSTFQCVAHVPRLAARSKPTVRTSAKLFSSDKSAKDRSSQDDSDVKSGTVLKEGLMLVLSVFGVVTAIATLVGVPLNQQLLQQQQQQQQQLQQVQQQLQQQLSDIKTLLQGLQPFPVRLAELEGEVKILNDDSQIIKQTLLKRE
ncbi:hypothetical protein PLESTB_000360000 [Pleodorina starrii]|uniref:Uncharacterized protein n=1 Tax=Pleodorina starrii TaxID=330485 RepID=A0A9W6BEE0_9CHLO|nr:hypothetical protein PLESTM_000035300 [Pleodorina starrii]GLC50260.1 hypothetical protein PLESTB_000360000 [Pleodorina starrii]GLC64356.1 hypothetical protein PLESTF_000152600 [Pleodorina starrii]